MESLTSGKLLFCAQQEQRAHPLRKKSVELVSGAISGCLFFAKIVLKHHSILIFYSEYSRFRKRFQSNFGCLKKVAAGMHTKKTKEATQ